MSFEDPRPVDEGNSKTQPISDTLWTIQEEFNDFMLGRYLGGGETRRVYEAPWDPENYVIKVERPAFQFCNAAEWGVWGDLRDKPAGAWLAPCRAISRSGAVLIMRRTQPVTKLPPELPAFFCDVKPENFGMLDGRLVCHDYGYHSMNIIAGKLRMKRVPSAFTGN